MVLNNGRPPYWNSTSDFDYHLCVVIGMSVKTTSGFGKRTAAILEFYFRFPFWPTCSRRHVVLHLCAKFRRNRPIGGAVMTSSIFKMASIESEI